MFSSTLVRFLYLFLAFQESLKHFFESRTNTLSDMESKCIHMTESRERKLAEISQLKV